MVDKISKDYKFSKQVADIKKIEDRIEYLTQKLVEKQPTRFKIRDLVYDFFASLIVGLTLTFKGNLAGLVAPLHLGHIAAIIGSTLIILTGEIYFVGYMRISDKKARPFFTFWLDRFLGYYAMAVLVSVYIIFMFGFNLGVENNGFEVFKMVVALSMPCAIAAAIPSLFKDY